MLMSTFNTISQLWISFIWTTHSARPLYDEMCQLAEPQRTCR